eukprot:408791-Alexandrium_andersonii.AAC.1
MDVEGTLNCSPGHWRHRAKRGRPRRAAPQPPVATLPPVPNSEQGHLALRACRDRGLIHMERRPPLDVRRGSAWGRSCYP